MMTTTTPVEPITIDATTDATPTEPTLADVRRELDHQAAEAESAIAELQLKRRSTALDVRLGRASREDLQSLDAQIDGAFSRLLEVSQLRPEIDRREAQEEAARAHEERQRREAEVAELAAAKDQALQKFEDLLDQLAPVADAALIAGRRWYAAAHDAGQAVRWRDRRDLARSVVTALTALSPELGWNSPAHRFSTVPAEPPIAE